MKKFEFIAENGVPFAVVFEEAKGSHSYGPTVSFFDRRYNALANPPGQFGGQYYVSSLLEDEDGLTAHGLNLYGGVTEWSVDGKSMGDVFDWIATIVDELTFKDGGTYAETEPSITANYTGK